MHEHPVSEISTALVVCMSIAVAVILVMLSALLVSSGAEQRKKWIPRYITVTSVIAVVFCMGMIFCESSEPNFSAICRMAIVFLIVALWASFASGMRWCTTCGTRFGGLKRNKTCPNCAKDI